MNDLRGCLCIKNSTYYSEFEKIADLKNTGLIMYRHFTRTNDVNSKCDVQDISREVLILHNTSDKDITAENFVFEFGQYKKCPRCKYVMDHAEKLLRQVSTINKFDVLGICDKCSNKERNKNPCCGCSEVLRKFLTKGFKKTEENKVIISLKQNLIKSAVNKDKDVNKLNDWNNSQSSLNKLFEICRSSKEIHMPFVVDLIEPNPKLNESFQEAFPLEKVHFSEAAQKAQSLYREISDSKTISFNVEGMKKVCKSIKRKYLSDDNINITSFYDYSEDLNRDGKKLKLDSYSRTYSSQESLTFSLQSIVKSKPATFPQTTKKDEEYKTPNISTIPKDDNILKIGKKSELRLRKHLTEESRQVKGHFEKLSPERGSKAIQKSYRKSVTSMSDVGTSILKERKEKTLASVIARKFHSEDTLLSSALQRSQESLQGFSYFFIREANVKKKPTRKLKSSTELIKETQDMIYAREEALRKKREEEQKLKAEEEQRKRIEHEEKIRLLKESKRLLQKEKEAQRENLEPLHKEIIVKEKALDVDSKKISIKEKVSKESRTASEKSKKSTEIKAIKYTDIDSKKEQKEKEKLEKDEKMRLEKERKRKEKEEKDKLKKEKEEQMRRAKQEKEERLRRAKEEKEEQLRITREEKEKQKKEKEEQLKKEKERQKLEKNDKERHKELQPVKEEKQRKTEEEKIHIQKQKEDIQMKPMSNKNARDEAELKMKRLKETETTTEPEKPEPEKIIEEPKIKELNIDQVKVRKPSPDDLILQLVKLKQSNAIKQKARPKRLSEIDVPLAVITEHKGHKGRKLRSCVICNDSELELDIENIILHKDDTKETADIIIGQKIFKYKPPLVEKPKEKEILPILFASTFKDTDISEKEPVKNITQEIVHKQPPLLSIKNAEQEVPKGVIRYALSDRTFIDKGWTMLPTEKVVRKMNVYRMRPAHPEFDWFEHNKNKKIMFYDTGEKLAEFDDNGRGRWYYRSGRLALDYYDAEEINAQQRFVIHSSGELDERGRSRPLAILAAFDYLGNGVVFDHAGKIRLKYNQTEGVVLDRSIGPVSHWKWHTLNDPPVLQQVMIDTQMAHKDPDILKLGGPADNKARPDNEEMLAIEFDNFIKEKSKKLSQKFKPFQIKMKALKINEHFSLKVLDQATIYLIFRDGSTNLKLNIGMILDHQEIVDTDTAEVGEVSNSLERFPARTDSLAGLQRSVAYAQRIERARVERERRLRPNIPSSSSDKLTAAASRPLRPQLHTAPSDSTVAQDCRCKCRKSPSLNLYYDTRLV